MPERRSLEVIWPDGRRSQAQSGEDWLQAAAVAGYAIPTGCLGGSCGACEIEVNGQLVRACIATVPASASGQLVLEIAVDPHW
ncbi:2Fe-2S iron-sulfur cluster-binding protein [Vulcanococcus limneticus]|uniref:2Fe-2S iron-sulfur cluster-binding protein n=1 Tax=Vulcanococcus limneticus TaxID=2170428 RepID=UPI000B99CEED|nr:2Fe-2S iron-sulfur cluster-binding protein [Vulcanococcus limneticus]MCP9790445.1 2Fe-2S iron-sulfur cluster binding domain-containing protein [Vulcanococcus limneticus MW73D5]MCP9892334.1 2Fe-2S iron-sulfur cluster binding domain-containing protein [Vulcanococcus limneticus Candia 3F8]MCP9895844.1 2Fe-2S iron-sulfur cluster binding domain-containing protein [Vulcanococcus limneticus Candia 3B3]